MNKIIKLFLSGTFILFLHLSSFAQDFKIDGIYYEFNRGGGVTVTLSDNSSEKYSGSITIPESVSYEGTTYPVNEIGTSAFANCVELTSINIPTSVDYISAFAFQNCSALSSITIPSSVTNIDQEAFENCSALTSFTIPSGVKSIGYDAFKGCTKLTDLVYNAENCTLGTFVISNPFFPSTITTLTIGEKVSQIPDEAFYDCNKLTSITCYNTTPPTISDNVFNSDTYTNAKLYVPESALNTYKTADVWSKFIEKDVAAIKGIFGDEFADEVGRYNLQGLPVDSSYQGFVLIRYSNGKVHKHLIP